MTIRFFSLQTWWWLYRSLTKTRTRYSYLWNEHQNHNWRRHECSAKTRCAIVTWSLNNSIKFLGLDMPIFLPRFVFWIATAAGCTKLQANHDTIQTSSNFTHQEQSIRIGTSYAFCVYQNLAAAKLSRKLRPWSVLSFGSRLNWGVFLQWCTSPPLHPSWSSPATLANSDDFSGSVGWWESSTAARF